MHSMSLAAAGGQVLVGLAALVLGILGLVGILCKSLGSPPNVSSDSGSDLGQIGRIKIFIVDLV